MAHLTVCDICRLEHTGKPLPPEAQLLHVIAQMERNYGKANTTALATELYMSRAQVWRYLCQLEEEGRVKRVGERGGWRRVA